MNVQSKLTKLETIIKDLCNKPRIFILFKNSGGYEYAGDNLKKTFPDLNTFKNEVSFNPANDLLRIVEFV
jgi:hypothetical protein